VAERKSTHLCFWIRLAYFKFVPKTYWNPAISSHSANRKVL